MGPARRKTTLWARCSRRKRVRERKLEEALLLESVARLLRASLRGDRLTPLSEIISEAGITQEELDALPDPELDADQRTDCSRARRFWNPRDWRPARASVRMSRRGIRVRRHTNHG